MNMLILVPRQTKDKYIKDEKPIWPSSDYHRFPQEFTKFVKPKDYNPLEKVLKKR